MFVSADTLPHRPIQAVAVGAFLIMSHLFFKRDQ